MVVLMCGNAKGGTAKSTTAAHLAAGFAARGRRTLLVDMDPQGHATAWFAGLTARRRPGLAEALISGRLEPHHVRRVLDRPGLELLGAGPKLGPIDLVIARRCRGGGPLRALLDVQSHRWDLVVLDTPPHVGSAVTLAALLAADEVIVPFQPSFFALDGLAQLEARLHESWRLGGRAALLGCLAVAVDARERAASATLEQLRSAAPEKVLRSVVRVSAAQKTLASHGALAWDAREDRRGAEDWEAVLREVEERIAERAWSRVAEHALQVVRGAAAPEQHTGATTTATAPALAWAGRRA